MNFPKLLLQVLKNGYNEYDFGGIDLNKLKVLGVPAVVSLLILALVYAYHLKEQSSSPSSDWSRSMQIFEVVENTDSIEVVELKNNYKIYIPGTDKITEVTLNQKLEQVEKREISINVPKNGPLWVDQQGNMVYLKEGTLFHFNNGNENVIYKEVNGMRSQENKIIFWSGPNIYELSTNGFKINKLLTIKHAIEDVTLGKNSESLLVHYSPSEKIMAVDYYYFDNQKNSFTRLPIMERTASRIQAYIGFGFTEREGMTHIVYSSVNFAHGQRKYTSYYSVFSPLKTDGEPKFEMMALQSEETGRTLDQEEELVFKYENGPKVWLVAESELTRRKDAINIFEASLSEENTWIAKQRSMTANISHLPIYIGDDIIIWEDFDPGSDAERILLAASTDPYLIDRAGQFTKDDIVLAASDTLISIAGGTIVILFGFLWFVLPILLIFFLPENIVTRHSELVNHSIMGLFMIIQILLSQKMLGSAFYYYAPPYLTFNGAGIIIFLVLGVISWIVTRIAGSKDWSSMQSVSYFMIVNTIFTMLLVGPYIF
jgi:hypothetical protein